jgi:hypothetical protein
MSEQNKLLKPATAWADAGAMANAAQVEELADHLSQLADAMHARIMRAIRKQGSGGSVASPVEGAAPAKPELLLSRTEAQAMFDLEVALRQNANSL